MSSPAAPAKAAPPARFADLNKKTSDLLSNDYCFDKKFKLTTKSANGMTFTAEGTLGKKVDSKLTAKWSPMAGVMIDKACVNNQGRVFGDVTVKDLGASGLDVLVRLQDGAGKKGDGELEVRLAKEKITAEAIVNVVTPTITGNVTYQLNPNVTLGATAVFDTKYDDDKSPMQFTNYDVAVAYAKKDVTAVVSTKAKFTAAQLSVFHDVSAAAQVAGQVNFSAGAKEGDAKAVDLTLGAIYAIDADAKVQAKVDSKGLVSANYIQTIKPGVKGIASVQLDSLNLAGDSHKFGLSLILG